MENAIEEEQEETDDNEEEPQLLLWVEQPKELAEVVVVIVVEGGDCTVFCFRGGGGYDGVDSGDWETTSLSWTLGLAWGGLLGLHVLMQQPIW